jgi:hypothetical protein
VVERRFCRLYERHFMYALQDQTVRKVVAIATEENGGKGPIPNYVPSLDLNEILATERERAAKRVDGIFELGGLRFVEAGPKDIALTGDYDALRQPKTLNATAEYHVAQKVGVPAPFFSKCSSDLKLRILAEHGKNLEGKRVTKTIDGEKVEVEKAALIRIDHDGRVRAMLSPSYTISDNLPLIEASIKLLNTGGATAAYLNIGDNLMNGRLLFPSKEQTLGNGDRLVPGVQIRNSEVGLSSYAWETALFRVQCWNGLISADGSMGGILLRHTGKANQDLFSRLDEAMNSIIAAQPRLMQRVSRATEIVVDDGEEFIRNGVSRYGVPKNMIDTLIEEARVTEAKTAYDYLNVLTATAQGKGIDQRIAIERSAGKWLAGLKN